MSRAEAIVALMTQDPQQADVQLVQTRFKLQLAYHWQIPPDSRILEIGCGQGDMTAVLADAVGPRGHVVAVDIAGPAYGAPVTLGESASRLLDSPLGPRIEFHFQFDVLDPSVAFEAGAFDYVVLTHSSWYFGSVAQLSDVLRRVRPWAKRLCFSEWSMTPGRIEQVAHMLAVLIQGQLEAFKAASDANIRTPLSKPALIRLLHEAGWTPMRDADLQAPHLQDAGWEIDHCLGTVFEEVSHLDLPPRLVPLLISQLDVLARMIAQHPILSLDSYAVVAE
jgi:SAM-dependent methyltransferase